MVDRKDLDYQTTKEFNSFSDGSVDGTDNTKALVGQFALTQAIVATIQKLNNAISSQIRWRDGCFKTGESLLFDGVTVHGWETHKRIKQYFNNNQMFGFIPLRW